MIGTAAVYSLAGKRVYVAGHTGMAGSAIVRRLATEACEVITRTRAEADLRRQADAQAVIGEHKPHVVIFAAGRVGGIRANSEMPVEFLTENLAMALNVIQASFAAGVERLLFLGSTCIYPRLAPQPIAESQLLTGPLEPTNEWYAIAKIAGVKMAQAYRKQHGVRYISAMPSNLYGPGDNYHPDHSHVVAALIRRFHEARETGAESVVVWGTGTPRREFLFVDDFADACVFLLKNYDDDEIVNIGVGHDISISEFACVVAEVIGFKGRIVWDSSMPDGMPRKLLDVSKLNRLGWQARTGLRDGLARAYQDFRENPRRREL